MKLDYLLSSAAEHATWAFARKRTAAHYGASVHEHMLYADRKTVRLLVRCRVANRLRIEYDQVRILPGFDYSAIAQAEDRRGKRRHPSHRFNYVQRSALPHEPPEHAR